MKYEEYLDILDNLKNRNSEEDKEKLLKSDLNEKLREMVEPKIIETIKIKYSNSINRIVREINNIFSDSYLLEQQLVNFRKEVLFIYDLTNIKELSDNSRNEFQRTIKEETEKVYNVLISKANEIDPSGNLALSIRNSKIRWRE